MAMVDKDQPGDGDTGKKRSRLLSVGSKLPIDGILLVVVPFVAFVVLFLYVMGYLPPDPVVVVIDGMEVAGQPGPEDPAGPAEAGVPVTGEQASAEDTVGPMEPGTAATPDIPEMLEGVETGISAESVPDEAVEEDAARDLEKSEKVKQLAKVYEQMNAGSVAAIVSSLSDADAIAILSRMKPRNAGKVLASLDPEKAAALSLMLTE
jgi:hypothetical protein